MAGQQETFQQNINLGHSAAWDQKWDKAVEYYCQALDEFPDHPQALANLGLAYIELQDYQAALKCYEKAARNNPSDPIAFEKIAQLYERLGNLDRAVFASLRAADLYLNIKDVSKAIQNWERVVQINPANLQARSRLAVVHERTGLNQQAINEYLAVASIFQANGDLDKANKAVRQALLLNPQSDEAKQALGLLKDFKSLPKPAQKSSYTAPLRMAQALSYGSETSEDEGDDDKNHPVKAASRTALTTLAGILFETPEDETVVKRQGLHAIVTGAGFGAKNPDRTRLTMHLSQVIDMQTRDDLQPAADELQHAMDVGLDHPAADFDMGYLLCQINRADHAVRFLQRVLKDAQFAFAARLLLGEYSWKKEDCKQAAGHYLEALRLAEIQVVGADNSEELYQLYDPIIETLLRKPPQILQALCENIRTLLMQNNWEERLVQARSQLSEYSGGSLRPVVEMLTESHSGHLMDAMSQIKAFRADGLFRSALDQAYYALDYAPTYLPLHRIIGDLMEDLGNQPAALAKYQTIAKSYSSRGDAYQAISLYRTVLDLCPTDLQVRNRLIAQLIAANQAESAVQEYTRLAEIYYRQADFSTSRRIYTDALRVALQTNVDRSVRVEILHRMADIDMQSMDWRQAMRVFEQIRTIQPDDEKARYRLVELNLRLDQEKQALSELDQYLDHLFETRQDETAVSFLQSLADENPQLVPFRRRLADLYRRLGRKEDAVIQLDAIGELLLEGGDRAGAIQIVDTLLGLEPDNRDVYDQLLKQLRGERI